MVQFCFLEIQLKYGYAIGNPVKIGVIGSALSIYRKSIPDSEIAASYIKTGAVKLFATEEDASKYARSKRDDFGDITQPAYFYVEVKDAASMEEKKETCHTDPNHIINGVVLGCAFTHEASFYEVDATNLTPIRGQLSKNVRFTVELTADGEPLHTPSSCVIS